MMSQKAVQSAFGSLNFHLFPLKFGYVHIQYILQQSIW